MPKDRKTQKTTVHPAILSSPPKTPIQATDFIAKIMDRV
jgi:hypothetical protein